MTEQNIRIQNKLENLGITFIGTSENDKKTGKIPVFTVNSDKDLVSMNKDITKSLRVNKPCIINFKNTDEKIYTRIYQKDSNDEITVLQTEYVTFKGSNLESPKVSVYKITKDGKEDDINNSKIIKDKFKNILEAIIPDYSNIILNKNIYSLCKNELKTKVESITKNTIDAGTTSSIKRIISNYCDKCDDLSEIIEFGINSIEKSQNVFYNIIENNLGVKDKDKFSNYFFTIPGDGDSFIIDFKDPILINPIHDKILNNYASFEANDSKFLTSMKNTIEEISKSNLDFIGKTRLINSLFFTKRLSEHRETIEIDYEKIKLFLDNNDIDKNLKFAYLIVFAENITELKKVNDSLAKKVKEFTQQLLENNNLSDFLKLFKENTKGGIQNTYDDPYNKANIFERVFMVLDPKDLVSAKKILGAIIDSGFYKTSSILEGYFINIAKDEAILEKISELNNSDSFKKIFLYTKILSKTDKKYFENIVDFFKKDESFIEDFKKVFCKLTDMNIPEYFSRSDFMNNFLKTYDFMMIHHLELLDNEDFSLEKFNNTFLVQAKNKSYTPHILLDIISDYIISGKKLTKETDMVLTKNMLDNKNSEDNVYNIFSKEFTENDLEKSIMSNGSLNQEKASTLLFILDKSNNDKKIKQTLSYIKSNGTNITDFLENVSKNIITSPTLNAEEKLVFVEKLPNIYEKYSGRHKTSDFYKKIKEQLPNLFCDIILENIDYISKIINSIKSMDLSVTDDIGAIMNNIKERKDIYPFIKEFLINNLYINFENFKKQSENSKNFLQKSNSKKEVKEIEGLKNSILGSIGINQITNEENKLETVRWDSRKELLDLFFEQEEERIQDTQKKAQEYKTINKEFARIFKETANNDEIKLRKCKAIVEKFKQKFIIPSIEQLYNSENKENSIYKAGSVLANLLYDGNNNKEILEEYFNNFEKLGFSVGEVVISAAKGISKDKDVYSFVRKAIIDNLFDTYVTMDYYKKQQRTKKENEMSEFTKIKGEINKETPIKVKDKTGRFVSFNLKNEELLNSFFEQEDKSINVLRQSKFTEEADKQRSVLEKNKTIIQKLEQNQNSHELFARSNGITRGGLV